LTYDDDNSQLEDSDTDEIEKKLKVLYADTENKNIEKVVVNNAVKEFERKIIQRVHDAKREYDINPMFNKY
jgi:hypothetical protein